jgi:hypothetical protein
MRAQRVGSYICGYCGRKRRSERKDNSLLPFLCTTRELSTLGGCKLLIDLKFSRNLAHSLEILVRWCYHDLEKKVIDVDSRR